ncbi:MAG: hypothetical protein WC421_01370 [Elusimicrobiales bacterium]
MEFVGRLVNWIFKYVAVVLLGLLLAAGVCSYIASRMFTPAQLAELAAAQIEDFTGRPALVGSAEVSLVKGIRIKSLRVIDNASPFGADLASAKEIDADFELLPLLGRRLVIKSLTLVEPRVNLVRYADGRWNFAGAAGRPGRAGGAGPAAVHAESISITGGAATLRDIASGTARELDDINLQVWNFSWNKYFPASFAARYAPRAGAPPVSFSGDAMVTLAGLKWQDAAAPKISLRAEYRGKKIVVDGNVADFSAPKVAFDAAVPAVAAGELEEFPGLSLPDGRVSARLRFERGGMQITGINGNFGPAVFSAEAEADFPHDAPPVYKIEARTTAPVDLAAAAGRWDKLAPYSPSGSARAELALSGRGGQVSVDTFTVTVSGGKFKWGGFAVSDAAFSVSARPADKSLEITVSSGACAAYGQNFSLLSGRLGYAPDTLSVPAFSGSLGGETFKLSMTIKKLKSADRLIYVMLDAQRIRFPQLFITVSDIAAAIGDASPERRGRAPRTFSGPLAWLRNFRERLPAFMPNIKGSLHAREMESPVVSGRDLYAEVNLRGLAPGMKTLAGTIDVQAGPGVIYRLEEMASRDQALKITFSPFLAMHKMDNAGALKAGSVLEDAGYNTMGAAVDFRSGDMTAENFYLSGPVISACGSGDVGWADEDLGVSFYTLFSRTRNPGSLSESLTDASGKPALAFTVTGSMTEPKVSINSPRETGGRIERAVKKAVRTDFRDMKRFVKTGR